jgi:lactate dehydrogenase-like 2-hydroxyacid dehydrogenase
MPRGSYLINIARGGHVVEADLIDAVRSGQLAGAALDVQRPSRCPRTIRCGRCPGSRSRRTSRRSRRPRRSRCSSSTACAASPTACRRRRRSTAHAGY